MCLRDRIFGDNNGGCCVAMTVLRNCQPRQRRRLSKMSLRSWRRQLRSQLRNQKIQRVRVNVSDDGGAGVFIGSGYWQRQRQSRRKYTGLQNQQQQRRRRQRTRIREASEGSETLTEATRDIRRDRGIYDNNGFVGGGRWERRLQQRQRQRRCRQRIEYASKGSETTTEAALYWRQAWWIGNDNGVLIFLAIAFLTVTLSCLYLVAISFLYCFHQIPFFVRCNK